jgi:hypothetical protein
MYLAKLLLAKDLRGGDEEGVHDSVEDAAAAVALVLREVQQTEPTGLLDPPQAKVGVKNTHIHMRHFPSEGLVYALYAVFPGICKDSCVRVVVPTLSGSAYRI